MDVIPKEPSNAAVLERIELLETTLEECFVRHIGILSEDFQAKLSIVSEQVGSLTEKVQVMGEDMREMKVDIASIKNVLDRKVDYDEFTGLEQRVSHLEAKRENR